MAAIMSLYPPTDIIPFLLEEGDNPHTKEITHALEQIRVFTSINVPVGRALGE